MSTKDIDLEALNRDLQELARQQKRGWWKRNRLWFVPVVLLALIAIGGAAVYWSLFTRIHNLDTYVAAMKTIEADAKLQATLGTPIKAAGWPPPSPRLEAGEREIRWDIQGPKGKAKAHIHSRMMMGKWETIIFEVLLADGKKISLLEEGGADDAPAFLSPAANAGKPDAKKPDANSPSPEVNLQIPTDDPPGGQK